MTITTAPARNEYIANAGQTIFNYTFKIFENTDLNVYITPSGVDANDSSDLTTAYTVDPSTIGSDSGGFITLSSGTNANDLVTIVSDVPSSRTTDYQNNGDFRPDTVNADFDRVVSIAKKIEDTANRTVLLQQSQQDPKPLTLPTPKAGLGVRWNGGESGLENYTIGSIISNEDIASDKVVINYSSLLSAVNDVDLKLNQACNLKERVSGYGGAAMWDVVLSSSVTPNTFNIVQCVGEPTLALVLRLGSRPLDMNEWGAIPDWDGATGTDNYPVFQAVFDEASVASARGKEVNIAYGDYMFSSPVIIDASISFMGEGRGATRLFFTNATSQAIGFDLGGIPGVTAGAVRFEHMQVVLLDDDLIGVRLNGNQFTTLNDLFVRGSSGTSVSSIGIMCWGGTLSGFFNRLQDILLQSLNVGIEMNADTGFLTNQVLDNVSGILLNTGINFVGFNGLSSQIYAGNWESCGVGIQFETAGLGPSTDKVQMFGVRFEANTVDVDLGTDSFRNTLFLQNANTIVDNGTGSGNLISRNGNINEIFINSPKGNFGTSNIAIGNTEAFDSFEISDLRKNCIAIGPNTSNSLVEGLDVIAIGDQAFQNHDGDKCIFIGTLAGGTGAAPNLQNCTGVGNGALRFVTGNGHTALGASAGLLISSGSNNLTLGQNAGYLSSPFDITTESNRIVLGDNNITNAYVKVSWTVTSDERDKSISGRFTLGLDFINKLKPIEFYYDDRSRYSENENHDGSKKDDIKRLGLSAQEVLIAEKELGISGVVNEENPDKLLLIETSLVYSLINSVNELTERVKLLENK